MRILLIVLSLLVCAGLSARRVPKKLRAHFTFCLTGEADIVNGRIMTNGYFMKSDTMHRRMGIGLPLLGIDTSFSRVIFYEDGSFYNELLAYRGPDLCPPPEHTGSVFQDSNFINNWMDWGIFRINGDTIIAEAIHPKRSNSDPWQAYEMRFKIIDPNNIQLFQWKELFPLDLFLLNRRQKATALGGRCFESKPARFISCDKIPPPHNWLKNENWFWCRSRN